MIDFPPDLVIRIGDTRAAGFCVSGTRKWFPDHDMDFKDFVRDGIDAATFLEKGDALAELVVQRKIDREASDG